MDLIDLQSQRENVDKAFKSLTKIGRPDILDDDNRDILTGIYVDLVEGDYFLKVAMDDNHVVFKGRRGTGKSTVFIHAEKMLSAEDGILPIYINLQTCYEVIRPSDGTPRDNLNKWNVYKTFFNEVLESIKKKCKRRFGHDRKIDELFAQIDQGVYVDADFERRYNVKENTQKSTSFEAGVQFSVSEPAAIKGGYESQSVQEYQTDVMEMRIYSINNILKRLTEILESKRIKKVYLFLDDFSELEKDSQQLIVDSLISPIISSYNKYFVVKLAAYPYRIYLGNIDSSKITQYSLDFYDVYEKTASNYKEVEALGIDYIRRTIKKRIEVYSDGQFDSDELFDTSKNDVGTYYKRLFYASAGIPRCLGYILVYSFLGSIHQGKPITLSIIDNSAKQYYLNNIFPEFYSDARFKQSFFDDEKILNRITQKRLLNHLIDLSRAYKTNQIERYRANEQITDIVKTTIVRYKTSNGYWLPSSHFSIEKDLESLLQTLELHYIVNKFNEGSIKRKPRVKMSFYGLNYGLCLENNIDYGKPELRRAYDYWRQDDFDYSEVIPKLLRANSVPKCSKCGYEYADESELAAAQKFKICLNCQATGTISNSSQIDKVLMQQIEKWRQVKLPDLHMGILRILFNKRDTDEELIAKNIAEELEVHHLAITKSCERLSNLGYVSYKTLEVRHYKITAKAIETFFKFEE